MKIREEGLWIPKQWRVILGTLAIMSFVLGHTQADEIRNEGTGSIKDYQCKRDETNLVFNLQNPREESYLWIMAHGCDKRKIEHGGLPLRIEVNGRVIEQGRSCFQEETYRYPVHGRSHMKTFFKFDELTRGWNFKYDVDFVMNNQTGGPGHWGEYTTVGYNHWYAFNLEGIAKAGTNRVVIAADVNPKLYSKRFYDGYFIGELGLFSKSEVMERIAGYDKNQILIDPKELAVKVAEIPAGKTPEVEAREGCVVKDGKPFLHIMVQGYSNTDNAIRNMLYFNWANTIQNPGWGPHEIAGYEGYLLPEWKQQNVIASSALNALAETYEQDILVDICYNLHINPSSVSPLVEKRIPDLLAVDSRGDVAQAEFGMFANLGSAQYREYIRQVIWFAGEKLRMHPGIFANIAHEELMWRCSSKYLPPQDPLSVEKYRKYLMSNYTTIEDLNQEWATNYPGFAAIAPPKTIEQTANFVNFQIFRGKLVEEFAQVHYLALKEAFPKRLVIAERSGGGFFHGGWNAAEDRCILTPWSDIRTIGNEGVATVRGEQRAIGGDRIVMEDDICFACQYKYVNSPFRFWWDPPLKKDARGITISSNNFYNEIMQGLFNGIRSYFLYSYDSSRHHFIHNQKQYKKTGDTAPYKWEIDTTRLDLPDIVVEEQGKQASAAYGLAYKTAPLLLPAKPGKGKVALLYTRRTPLIGFTFDESLKGEGQAHGFMPVREWQSLQMLMKHLQIPFEVLNEDTLAREINDYDVLIAGYWTTMGSPEMAETVRAFADKGGVVVFYPEAFAYNWNTAANHADSPGYGLADFFGATIKQKIARKEVNLCFENSYATINKGDSIKVQGLVTPLEKLESGESLACLNEGDSVNQGAPLIVRSQKGHAFYIGFTPGISYARSDPENAAKIRALFQAIIGKTVLQRPVSVAGDKQSCLVYGSLLHGKDYELLAVLNNYWEDQSLSVCLNQMPRGKYEIVDVTMEGKPALVAERLSAGDLRTEGLKLQVKAFSGFLFIIRKAGEKVLVDCPAYELAAIIKNQPVDIVLGDGLAESKIAEKVNQLQAFMEQRGVSARILKASEVSIATTNVALSESGCSLGEFQYSVINTTNNLILVGNVQDNRLIANLCQKGAYTYDKVLEDVDDKYPGKGRGIIQVAESVNKPYFCPTDRARDAILVGGSDEKGTLRAIGKFIELLKNQ